MKAPGTPRSNAFAALLFALLLLGGKIEAATLRGSFFFGDEPGKLTVHVAQGRIAAVDITLPRLAVSGDQSFFDPGTPTTYNGVPGREVTVPISALDISNIALRYTDITRSQARAVHSEDSYYVDSGSKTIFLPDSGGAAIVTSQDFTPFETTPSRHTISTHAIVTRKSSLQGKVLKLEFINYNLTAMYVALVLEQAKGGTWNLRIKVTRRVLDIDVIKERTYAAAARLRGRAEIDPTQFAIPEAPNQPHF